MCQHTHHIRKPSTVSRLRVITAFSPAVKLSQAATDNSYSCKIVKEVFLIPLYVSIELLHDIRTCIYILINTIIRAGVWSWFSFLFSMYLLRLHTYNTR